MLLNEILQRFDKEASSKRDKGDKFERFIAAYLRLDSLYAERFSNVWLWSDWPDHWGADTGIDLVAKERETDEYCAIQCKFFKPDHSIRKEDIDSFFTASGKSFKTVDGDKYFTSRMIVSTTQKWSSNAEEAIKDQKIPVARIGITDLENSPIDWTQFNIENPENLALKDKKSLREHQKKAIEKILNGFSTSDRGKLIMACGTGKTLTSLRLAEQVTKQNGLILFLVPSISLLSQTLREWTAESEKSFHAFAVCSDIKIGKKNNEDMSVSDLSFPATTDASKLADRFFRFHEKRDMTVIFSTYQSIQVISEAQKLGVPEFDIIICDEAHRTTGVTANQEDDSNFVNVHKQDFIKAKKRLYMTATPRLYADMAKAKAEAAGATLWSMDDEALYGSEFYRLGFGEAVQYGLLSDYKVMVLAVDEKHISKAFQSQIADENNEIRLDDAVKIIGCWNGLSNKLATDNAQSEFMPMKRAVAFASTIKDSKYIAETFQNVVNEYIKNQNLKDNILSCEVKHVDGTFNVLARNERLDWLKAETDDKSCRILSNVRCLSEGVDVPALDAVLFLNPRDSIVDIVQSVGRVMRKAPGKKYGYVILPIGIPADIQPDIALNDNQKYKIIWQVLQALRAHDDRFNTTVNQLELNKNRPDQIQVIGVGGGSDSDGEQNKYAQMNFEFKDIEEWKNAIYAKIVIKCGDRRYWEDWAKDVAQIAERHISRIKAILEQGQPEHVKAFKQFLVELQENINPSVTQDECIEMLSQHLITRPVFDALFENYDFAKLNPVSKSMQEILDVLDGQALSKEVEQLQGFYQSVRDRVSGIDNAEGRQKIIVELYDKFFKQAFPKMAERLGIVYTPPEVVDFIIHSTEHVLKEQFGVGLTSEDVHILDPFTGTGTFIVRLLQSGLIQPKDLERKYKYELHANEIVLLAYYIAAINIEETFHGIRKDSYVPFDGIVLTDTFQMAEQSSGNIVEQMFPENNKRVKRQKKKDIRVIMSNPPYSVGQKNENDNNQNMKYSVLDKKIRDTYAKESTANNKNSLYDSYIRAIRWASDRIKNEGIVAFVTNGSFIDSNAADGLRKRLAEEFSTIYCFNLRGNARTQGEQRRKEKDNVFGQGSRTPVAITLLIKNSAQKNQPNIFYYDIGDYLTREQKLNIIKNFHDIKNISFQKINPNKEGDWINHRKVEFENYLSLAFENNDGIFYIRSLGIGSSRDAWVYNFDDKALKKNMQNTITFYNHEVDRYLAVCENIITVNYPEVKEIVDSDQKKIKWSSSLLPKVRAGKKADFSLEATRTGLYRPFVKQWLYFDSMMNHRISKMSQLFPTTKHENFVITVTGVGAGKPFSALVTKIIPDLHMISTGQCFPLYYYEKITNDDVEKFIVEENFHGYTRKDSITDKALTDFRLHYSDDKIKKEDIFYYIYGILHSTQYRVKYQPDLNKMLPRVPFATSFWGFCKAGRNLAEWHLNYETIEPYFLEEEIKNRDINPEKLFYVEKMKFAKVDKIEDKTKIIYNSNVTLTGIPLEAYKYIVNGKSAIEWVMESYQKKVHEESQILNDPNKWSDNPRYIIDLLKRIVRVSIETVKIVKTLPNIE